VCTTKTTSAALVSGSNCDAAHTLTEGSLETGGPAVSNFNEQEDGDITDYISEKKEGRSVDQV
jgi:hypothetical protein